MLARRRENYQSEWAVWIGSPRRLAEETNSPKPPFGFQKFRSWRFVRSLADFQKVAEVLVACRAVSAPLRGDGSAVKRAQTVRLFFQSGLKMRQRFRGLLHFEQHFAQKLARGRKRTGCDGTFAGTIFHLRGRLHHAQGLLVVPTRQ